jgi:hypothetical protein
MIPPLIGVSTALSGPSRTFAPSADSRPLIKMLVILSEAKDLLASKSYVSSALAPDSTVLHSSISTLQPVPLLLTLSRATIAHQPQNRRHA